MTSVLAIGLLYTAPVGQAAEYNIDPDHTVIGFKTRHLGVVTVPGRFHEYEGDLIYDGEDLSSLRLKMTIHAASIDTDNENRDDHLRSEDYFEVTTYPHIDFITDRVEERDGQTVLIGSLTIKETTQEVKLPFTLSGPVEDPWGNQRVGLEIEGSIDRHEYGVGFDGLADRTIGNTVRFDVNIQAIQAADEE